MLFVQYVPLLFLLDGFLCQWEVRLKKSNNALAKPLLRDSAEWSLTMLHQLEDRWPWLAKCLHLLFGIKSDAVHISTGVNEQVLTSSQQKLHTLKRGEAARVLKHKQFP